MSKTVLILLITQLVLTACSDGKKPSSGTDSIRAEMLKSKRAPVNAVRADGIRLAVKAVSSNNRPTLEPDTFFARIGKTRYQVTTAGVIRWSEKKRGSVNLDTEGWVSPVFLDTIDTKYLLVFYEEDMATYGAAAVEKFDLETGERIWRAPIPAFNLGQPYITEDKFAYLTTGGTIGKLNLRTGKFMYKFNELYDRQSGSFNNFDSISFQNNKTYFISKNRRQGKTDTVVLDERSGKISVRK